MRMHERRGRPRKADHEKLVPVSTNVRPVVYEALKRAADAQGLSVAALVRRQIQREALRP